MIVGFLLACAAFGTSARIETNAQSVQIGEPFEVTFVIEHPTGASVTVPEPSLLMPNLAFVADLGVRREIDPKDADTTTTRVRWRVMALEGGEMVSMTIDVAVQGSGATQMLHVIGPKLSVAHALKEGEDAPRPARGFRDAPHVTTAASKLTWIALGIVGLAAGYIAYRIARRPKQAAPAAVPGVAERLAQLGQRVNAEPERARDHVFALTALLRQALDAHVGENRAALSDGDWIGVTAIDGRVPAASREIVARLLTDAERVKYAGETPSLLGVRDSLTQANTALTALTAHERTAA